MYYVCDIETFKVIRGPFAEQYKATKFVTDEPMEEQRKICTMSRYQLAKQGVYPKTRVGDRQLKADLYNATRAAIAEFRQRMASEGEAINE